MPQCQKCPNQFQFSYTENSYNEAEYDAAGNLIDVVYKEFYDLENIKCMVCGSKDVEGKL